MSRPRPPLPGVPAAGAVESFAPQVDDDDVVDLRRRLAMTRWPEPATEPGDAQGPALDRMRALVARWQDGYDWDRLRARLTSVPQVRVEVDGLGLHALRSAASGPADVPLLLVHGWPSTCFEFLDVMSALAEGAAGVQVVAPSLPGYAYSDRPDAAGWGIERTADAFVALMEALGHRRFVVHGGDWGAVVASSIARRHPQRVIGLHLTLPIARVEDVDREAATPSERAGLAREADYRRTGYGYAQIQGTRPQTIGYSLVESPVGLCAWIAEKLWAWSDVRADGSSFLSDDAVLDVVSTYWLTATGASAARLYREVDWRSQFAPVDVPTGCSIFPAEIIRPPRSAVSRHYRDLRHWREMDRGGHFAAAEVPDDLAAELTAFVKGLETSPVFGQANNCPAGAG